MYMVQCNRCNLQYIGETKRRLKDRFNEHRRAVDKTNIKSKPTTVSEHFLSHLDFSFLVVYLERRFNGEFFALRVWGAYIRRGLYTKGLIFGILRYLTKETCKSDHIIICSFREWVS